MGQTLFDLVKAKAQPSVQPNPTGSSETLFDLVKQRAAPQPSAPDTGLSESESESEPAFPSFASPGIGGISNPPPAHGGAMGQGRPRRPGAPSTLEHVAAKAVGGLSGSIESSVGMLDRLREKAIGAGVPRLLAGGPAGLLYDALPKLNPEEAVAATQRSLGVKADPARADEFWASQVPEGIGGTLGFGAQVAATGPLGPALGLSSKGAALASGAGVGALGGAGQAYERTLQETGDETRAWQAASIGGLLGATEAADVLVAGGVGKGLAKINKKIGGLLTDLVFGSILEAGQEGTQEVFSDLAARRLDNQDRSFLEDVRASLPAGAKGAKLGGVIGVLLGGGGAGARGLSGKGPPLPAEGRSGKGSLEGPSTEPSRASVPQEAARGGDVALPDVYPQPEPTEVQLPRRAVERPGKPERRVDPEKRKRLDDIDTAADLEATRLEAQGDHLGALAVLQEANRAKSAEIKRGKFSLPGERAFAEAERTGKVETSGDLDGLKAANDAYGHGKGDELLGRANDIIAEEAAKTPGVEAFHTSGDEFRLISKSQADAEAVMKRVDQRLKALTVEGVETEKGPNPGKASKIEGFGISWGHGDPGSGTLYEGGERARDFISKSAEDAMYAHKEARTKSGERVDARVSKTPKGYRLAEEFPPAPSKPPVGPQAEAAPKDVEIVKPEAKATEAGEAATEGTPHPLTRLTEVLDKKPRALRKMFGRTPTPEQKAEHKALMKEWDAEYLEAAGAYEKSLKRPAAPPAKRPLAEPEMPKAGRDVSGLEVGKNVSNRASIESSLNEWEELPGVRELKLKEWNAAPEKMFYAADDVKRARALADEIRASGRIDPLIVVDHPDGPYILEGHHRLAALDVLGKESFPAIVVRDTEAYGEREAPPPSKPPVEAEAPKAPAVLSEPRKAAMRAIDEQSQAAYAQAAKLAPGMGERAAGPAHFDPILKAEALREFLRPLRTGATPEEAATAAKAAARKLIREHNAKRADPYWRRADMAADATIDAALEKVLAAEAPTKAEKTKALLKGKPPSDPATMTPAEVNREIARLEKQSSAITDEFIAAGRGNEKPSDRAGKTDPLTLRNNAVEDRLGALRGEIRARAGPDATSMPPGFKRRKPPESGQRGALDLFGGRKEAVAPESDAFDVPEEGFREKAYTAIVNDFQRIVNLEKAAPQKVAGETLEQSLSLFPGRRFGEAEKLERRVVEPIRKHFKENNVPPIESTPERVSASDYLYALHAKDMARFEGVDTGMSVADADAILAKAGPEYRRIQEWNRALNVKRLDALESSGLISKETRKAWEQKYGQDYVPVRTAKDPMEVLFGARGLAIRGKESKARKGRSSKADSPLVFALETMHTALDRAEANKIGNKLSELVEKNPEPSLWREESDANKIKEGEERLAFKKNGEQRWLVTEDKGLAEAFKRIQKPDPGVLRVIDPLLSFWHKTIIQYNPAFPLTNMPRDIGTAAIRHAIHGDYRAAIATTMHAIPAAKGAFEAIRTEGAGGKWGEVYRKARDAGALVGWKEQLSFDKRTKQFEKAFAESSSPIEKAKQLGQFMDDVNRATELGTRLVTFDALLKQGKSVSEAAMATRRITADFARHGSLGHIYRRLYMFSGANVQGITEAARSIGQNPGRAATVLGSLVGAGLASYQASKMLGDEHELDKLTENDKARFFGVMVGKRRYGVSSPYTFNVFTYLGWKLGEMADGKAKKGDALGDLAEQAINAMSPLPQGANLMQSLTPTVLRPAMEIAQNRDFADRPIYPDGNPFAKYKKPASQEHFRNTTPMAKEVSQGLSALTGGTKAKPGFVEIPPDAIDHLAKAAGGGLGTFLGRSKEVIRKMLTGQGDDIRASDIPFVRPFVNEASRGAEGVLFRKNVERIELAKAQKKAKEPLDDPKAPGLEPAADAAEKRIKALYDRLDKKGITEEQSQKIQEQINRLREMFNRRASRALQPQ